MNGLSVDPGERRARVLVEIIGGADQRFHAHVACVHEDRRGVADAAVAVTGDIAANLPLEHMLQIEIERGDLARTRGITRNPSHLHHLLDGMWRFERQRRGRAHGER